MAETYDARKWRLKDEQGFLNELGTGKFTDERWQLSIDPIKKTVVSILNDTSPP